MFGQLLQPLRHRLILLFTIVLVIPSAFGIITAADRYGDQVRQARESTVRFAILASNYETNLLWQSNRMVQNMANELSIQASALGSPSRGSECAALLRDAIRPYPAYALAVLRTARGDPVCQSDPAAQPTNEVANTDWFQRVIESQNDTVSGYLYAARLQEPVIVFASPVLDQNCKVIGVLSLAIRLDWLSAIGQEPGLPPDSMV